MKKIIVVWVDVNEPSIYKKELRVVYSDHPRFTKGTSLDFGFMEIASGEGFVIEVLP